MEVESEIGSDVDDDDVVVVVGGGGRIVGLDGWTICLFV